MSTCLSRLEWFCIPLAIQNQVNQAHALLVLLRCLQRWMLISECEVVILYSQGVPSDLLPVIVAIAVTRIVNVNLTVKVVRNGLSV